VYTLFFSIMKWDDEKLAIRGLVFLVAYAAVRSVVCAASRPFWYDELCTVAIARLPTTAAIWNAIEHGADSHPPTYYLLERFANYLVPNPHIAFRLSSVLGFCGIVLSVFVFVRRRSDAMCALLCSALTLMSMFYYPFAVEARGYALMSACVAFALVCYQRADAIKWVLLLGLSLAAAGVFQYYSVFALFPLAVAESAFFLQSRRLRLGVWSGLACGMIPLIVFWPMLSLLKKYYGAHFWAQPSLTGVLGFFGWFLNLSPYWGVAVAGAATVGVIAILVSECAGKNFASRELPGNFHENVLILALLAMPLAAFIAMKVTHGGLTERYMLPAGLGVPFALGWLLHRTNGRVLAVFGILLCFGLASQEGSFWLNQRHHIGKIISPAQEVEDLVDKTGRPDLPVISSDARDYLQLLYYGSAAWVPRLVTVVDKSQATAYPGSDNLESQLLILRSYIPLQVYEFHDFTDQHPEFLLYSAGTMFDSWPARLVDKGYVLRLDAVHENRRLYLVVRKDAASQEMDANITPPAMKGAQR